MTKKTEKLVNINGYTAFYNSRINNKGGGTCILLCSNIPHKRCRDLEVNVEKEIKSTYIEVTAKNGMKFIIGSLYRAPNSSTEPLTLHVQNTVDSIQSEKSNKSVILGMDHNMDSLKCHMHHATSKFLDGLTDREIFPTITRPTWITQLSAMLIDNVFISKDLHKYFDSCILLSDMSDHLLSLVLLKQNKLTTKEPLEFTSRHLMEMKISHIKSELNNQDWNGILNSENASVNCDTFSSTSERVIDTVAPLKKSGFQERDALLSHG